jgi:hypothetical protein
MARQKSGQAASRPETTCLHCESTCRLTTGAEVYPHRQDLHHLHFHVCDHCDARVGCHGDTMKPLGHAADKATRDARIQLHNRMLDPLWKKLPEDDRKAGRVRTYRFLAWALGIERRDCHTGMFTIERCRDAWRALKEQTPATIKQWNDARRQVAKEDGTDRKRRRRGKPRRKASPDHVPPIRGRDFDPAQAALNEAPW